MNIRQIEDPNVAKVAAVVEELLKLSGRMPSFMFIVEEIGHKPRYGLVGRFRSDPARAIGHLAIMGRKVTDFAADQAPDLDDPR